MKILEANCIYLKITILINLYFNYDLTKIAKVTKVQIQF